jgi:hypothetical protein
MYVKNKNNVGGGGLPLTPGFRRLLDKNINREGGGDPGAHPLFGAGTPVIRVGS